MTTITQLPGWGSYTLTATVEDSVRDFLGEFEADYDVPAVANQYRDALNACLVEDGIRLVGDDFYAEHPISDDYRAVIGEALRWVDLGTLL